MLFTYIMAVLIVFGVLAGWVGVQHLARRFAERHPEFGPAREEGAGCGFFCLCLNRFSCPKRELREKLKTEMLKTEKLKN